MNYTSKWAVGFSIAAASLLWAGSGAIAQEEVIIYIDDVDGVTEPRAQVDATIFPYVVEDLSDRALDTFYSNDQDYYNNRSIGRQLLWFFGVSHTENEINRDGRAISEFAQDAWHEQASSTATVRTRDLPNPFTSSLLLDPIVPEQQFPPTRIRQPIAPPTVAEPSSGSPGPVRALW
ncbi:MAG: hypothetical protein AB4042_15780 [Leptolyngbyaceae cyanobacterium]